MVAWAKCLLHTPEVVPTSLIWMVDVAMLINPHLLLPKAKLWNEGHNYSWSIMLRSHLPLFCSFYIYSFWPTKSSIQKNKQQISRFRFLTELRIPGFSSHGPGSILVKDWIVKTLDFDQKKKKEKKKNQTPIQTHTRFKKLLDYNSNNAKKALGSSTPATV